MADQDVLSRWSQELVKEGPYAGQRLGLLQENQLRRLYKGKAAKRDKDYARVALALMDLRATHDPVASAAAHVPINAGASAAPQTSTAIVPYDITAHQSNVPVLVWTDRLPYQLRRLLIFLRSHPYLYGFIILSIFPELGRAIGQTAAMLLTAICTRWLLALELMIIGFQDTLGDYFGELWRKFSRYFLYGSWPLPILGNSTGMQEVTPQAPGLLVTVLAGGLCYFASRTPVRGGAP